MSHDVVVLGASVAGLTVARRLAAEGYDVLVLDPNLEFRTAAIGHGVAAVGHASTVAAMAHAYGPAAVLEHARRNAAAMAEIRQIHPEATTLPLRDRSLPGGAESLRSAAVAAGAQVVHSVTVTHLTRKEGVTRIGFRNNLAWVRDVGVVGGVAVVDTLGVSPWGRAARIGPAQWVPIVR